MCRRLGTCVLSWTHHHQPTGFLLSLPDIKEKKPQPPSSQREQEYFKAAAYAKDSVFGLLAFPELKFTYFLFLSFFLLFFTHSATYSVASP